MFCPLVVFSFVARMPVSGVRRSGYGPGYAFRTSQCLRFRVRLLRTKCPVRRYQIGMSTIKRKIWNYWILSYDFANGWGDRSESP